MPIGARVTYVNALAPCGLVKCVSYVTRLVLELAHGGLYSLPGYHHK
jgi:hypothetical protein